MYCPPAFICRLSNMPMAQWLPTKLLRTFANQHVSFFIPDYKGVSLILETPPLHAYSAKTFLFKRANLLCPLTYPARGSGFRGSGAIFSTSREQKPKSLTTLPCNR